MALVQPVLTCDELGRVVVGRIDRIQHALGTRIVPIVDTACKSDTEAVSLAKMQLVLAVARLDVLGGKEEAILDHLALTLVLLQ